MDAAGGGATQRLLHTVILASDLREDFKLNEFVQRVRADPSKWIRNRWTWRRGWGRDKDKRNFSKVRQRQTGVVESKPHSS